MFRGRIGASILLASLTCRLLLASRPAWRELGDAAVEARLPSPALHGAALGGLSAWAVAIASYCRPTHDLSSAVRCTLAAISGCVGATALAVWVIPKLLERSAANAAQAERFASVVSFPLAAGGLALCLPSRAASFTVIALLGALAYRSASRGAGAYLSLPTSERIRAALLSAVIATLPALLAAPLCPAH